jgi:hypothetical protein
MAKRGNPIKHIGFEAAAEKAAAGEGESLANGKAMIAAAAHKASAAAKAKNPRLSRVGGIGKNKKAGAAG